MKPLLLCVLFAGLIQPAASRVQQRTFETPDGVTLLYGEAVPADYDRSQPRPLVLALHPGGERTSGYGAQMMRQIFLPGLRALDPIMIAPDCPTRTWADPEAEKALLALVANVSSEYAVDRRRILVVGFSMGGSGTWFMSSRHADLFTAAIVMAGTTNEPIDGLAKIPTYIIHSKDDQVVPFGQAEQRAGALEKLGRPVKFDALQGLSHFAMGSYVPSLTRAGAWVAERWQTQASLTPPSADRQ
jgi:predicted peptidase